MSTQEVIKIKHKPVTVSFSKDGVHGDYEELQKVLKMNTKVCNKGFKHQLFKALGIATSFIKVRVSSFLFFILLYLLFELKILGDFSLFQGIS